MQSIETLLAMNLLAMIILIMLVSAKLVTSFIMQYLEFKLNWLIAKEVSSKDKKITDEIEGDL